jgi:hypothetical protein
LTPGIMAWIPQMVTELRSRQLADIRLNPLRLEKHGDDPDESEAKR